MGAAFFLMADVPLVLEDAQLCENSIVGEVKTLPRESFSYLGRCGRPALPEDRHYVELAFGEGYAHLSFQLRS
jgi:hypothetical protein